MFLSLRELKFARNRFVLMGSVIGLIAVLVVMLSGLSHGLVKDGVSGLQRLPVQSFAFAEGSSKDAAFSRSIVDTALTEALKGTAGVEDATPFGNLLVNTKNQDGTALDLALFGVEVDGFLAPNAAQGDGLTTVDNTDVENVGIVVSPTVRDEGIEIGDTLTIDRLGHTMKVVGFTEDQDTFGHVDVAYIPLNVWQVLVSGAKPGEEVRPGSFTEATAIALQGKDIDAASLDSKFPVVTTTLKASFNASPGYSAETMTLNMIQVFLYAISALVVGAFFTVWTIQRKGELAVLRAMGAPRRYIIRDSITQAAIVLAISITGGVAVGVFAGLGLARTPMPFGLDAGQLAIAVAAMFVLGLLGAVVSVVRLTRIDPLEALGGQR
jgi:putative ABC transport system permease protein